MSYPGLRPYGTEVVKVVAQHDMELVGHRQEGVGRTLARWWGWKNRARSSAPITKTPNQSRDGFYHAAGGDGEIRCGGGGGGRRHRNNPRRPRRIWTRSNVRRQVRQSFWWRPICDWPILMICRQAAKFSRAIISCIMIKIDAPSGTAIKTVEIINNARLHNRQQTRPGED